MNSKSYFDLKFFFLSFLCLILPLSVLAAPDPAELLTGGPAPDPQFSDDCESSLIGGTDFTSVTQQYVYSYYITDIDYIETGENQYDDSGIVIASAFEQDYNHGNFHPELGGGLYQSDVYTIVSNPKVLREEYTHREDGVNRLIFALYSEVLDTQGALKLLFSYNIQGLRPGSDVKVEMDIEDLYSDCGPASNGILQLQVDMVSEGAVVMDVGVNRDPDTGKLCGDVDFEAVAPKASVITPVPGGLGPMTITCLMRNTIDLFLRHQGE